MRGDHEVQDWGGRSGRCDERWIEEGLNRGRQITKVLGVERGRVGIVVNLAAAAVRAVEQLRGLVVDDETVELVLIRVGRVSFT